MVDCWRVLPLLGSVHVTLVLPEDGSNLGSGGTIKSMSTSFPGLRVFMAKFRSERERSARNVIEELGPY